MEHERAYLRYVGSLGFAVSDLREVASETQAVTGTAALMKQGVDLISHGALGEGRWFGRPDVLRKTAQPSGLGPWSYEVYDCKLALVTKGATVLQLSLYSEPLTEGQGQVSRSTSTAGTGPLRHRFELV